ncbi:unnamed protein product [Rhodiola kirilowii]
MDLNPSANHDNQSSPPPLRPSSPTSTTAVPATLRKTTRTTRPKQPRKKRAKKCTIYKPEHTGLLLQIMNKLSEQAVQMKECEWKLSHIEHVNIKIGDLRKKAADKYEIYNVKPFFSTPEFSKGNFQLISNGRLIRHQVDECPFCHMIGERCGIRILTSHASDEETQTENED